MLRCMVSGACLQDQPSSVTAARRCYRKACRYIMLPCHIYIYLITIIYPSPQIALSNPPNPTQNPRCTSQSLPPGNGSRLCPRRTTLSTKRTMSRLALAELEETCLP